MSALTQGVQRPKQGHGFDSAPIAASTTIYQGGIVMLDTSGNAHPAAELAGAVCAGVALPQTFDLPKYDNSAGGAGALTVMFEQGVFGLQNDGANPILASTQPGTTVYAVDDQTVSLNAGTNRPVAGRLVRLDPSSIGGPVLVDMSEAIGKTAAEIVELDGGTGFLSPGMFRAIKNVAGHNNAGACTATGAKVGDVVLAVTFAKTPTATAGTQAGLTAFESTISVANQIQQIGTANLSTEDFDVLLLAQS